MYYYYYTYRATHAPQQLEDDAAFMDKYSRQIGAFGLEAMSKLMNLKVLIVGLRCGVLINQVI